MQSAGLTDAYDPEQELMALAAQTLRLISVAQALAGSSRHIDLDGLERHVGLICAKALDLAPGRAGLMKIELRRLLDELDSLDAAMRQNAA